MSCVLVIHGFNTHCSALNFVVLAERVRIPFSVSTVSVTTSEILVSCFLSSFTSMEPGAEKKKPVAGLKKKKL